MFSVSNIPHPFLNTHGTSQQERLPASLDPTTVSVDNRSTADLLGMITRFSTLVNFYNNDLERGSWQAFFSKSLPMLLAKLHNFDADELEEEYEQIALQIEEAPSKAKLKLMFDFVWKEMIEPLNELQSQFSEANPELELELNQPITRNLRDAIRNFIALSNSANKWYCTGIRDFYPLLEFSSWGLDVPDLYLYNENFYNTTAGTSKDRMIALKDEVSTTIAPFFEVIRTLNNRASDFLDDELESIEPGRRLQKPHLGLLFAFLKLFRHLQDNFNNLGTRHLEFFYEKVMGIQPQELTPDQAHVIVNIQKHIQQKEVKKGTLLKDGKDLNKQNIVYSFVEDVLFDKAQIVDVRTLYLNAVEGYRVGLLNKEATTIAADDGTDNTDEDGASDENDSTNDLEAALNDDAKKKFVEGIYIANNATAADGLEVPLEEGQSWPALGSKYSKHYPEVNPASLDLPPAPYADARLGFVLASPVLLLKEGKRHIKIDLTCSIKDLDCIETPSFRAKCVELQRAIQGRRYHFTQEIYEFLVDKGLCEKNGQNNIEGLSLLNLLYNEATGWKEDGLWILEDVLELIFPTIITQSTILLYTPDTDGILLLTPPTQDVDENGDVIPDSDYYFNLGTGNEVLGEVLLGPDGEPVLDLDGNQIIGIPLFDLDGVLLTYPNTDPEIPILGIPLFDSDGNPMIDPTTGALVLGIPDVNDFLSTIGTGVGTIVGTDTGTDTGTGTTPGSGGSIDLGTGTLTGGGNGNGGNGNGGNSNTEDPDTGGDGGPTGPFEIDINDLSIYYATILLESDLLNFVPVIQQEIIYDSNLILIREELELRQLFRLSFSGAEEWVYPDPRNIKVTATFDPTCGLQEGATQAEEGYPDPIIPAGEVNEVTLTFEVELTPEEEAVTFPDTEALGEAFSADMPLVKIEMDDELKLICKSEIYLPECALERCCPKETFMVSAYHFLRHLAVDDSCITVEVCGLKDIIVQNDESAQDVNTIVYPFGSRPKIYADFFIGSREVFCKKWKDVWVNVTWKDRPEDFKKHYRHYAYEEYEDGSTSIDVASFQFLPSLLDNGTWIDRLEDPYDPDSPRALYYLFHNDNDPNTINPDDPTDVVDASNCDPLLEQGEVFADFCPNPKDGLDPLLHNNVDSYHFKRSTDFPTSDDPTYACIKKEQLPLDISTRESFLRFSLRGVSFQHDRYAFVLAQQMSALSEDSINIVGSQAIMTQVGAVEECALLIKNKVGDVIEVTISLEEALLILCNEIDAAGGTIDTVEGTLNSVDSIKAAIEAAIGNIQDYIDNPPVIVNNPDEDPTNPNTTVEEVETAYQEILNNINTELSNQLISDIAALFTSLENAAASLVDVNINTSDAKDLLADLIALLTPPEEGEEGDDDAVDNSLQTLVNDLCEKLGLVSVAVENNTGSEGLPLEPYTPSIKEISLNYCAKATGEDISFIHIYPFHHTHKTEDIEAQPCLLPTYTDEGNLYIGFEQLLPGNVMNVLFQLAEATANSEIKKAKIKWHYLSRNKWLRLEEGFHIIEDKTFGLTRSGIVKINVPRNITKEQNTIMPDGLHWIKVSAFNNTAALGEIIGIHTQAALVSYQPTDLNNRASMLTTASNITKTVASDSKIKGIEQPYDSFGGKMKEAGNNLYLRFSERLRHKGRAVNMFDYERLALQRFSEIYRVKCITHAFSLGADKYRRDLEVAPGYVLLAVIPDPNQLKVGDKAVPRAPVSLLEDIQRYLSKRTNPFLRLKVDNPRYEEVHVQVHVQLYKGRSEAYYSELLAEEIREFLAPWRSGDLEKLEFGRPLSRSELVYFIETRPYVDYLCAIYWIHEDSVDHKCLLPIDVEECYPSGRECELWETHNPPAHDVADTADHSAWHDEYDAWKAYQAKWEIHNKTLISPLTARSILVAGKVKVCVVDNPCGVKFIQRIPDNLLSDPTFDKETVSCATDAQSLCVETYSANCNTNPNTENPPTSGGGLTTITL